MIDITIPSKREKKTFQTTVYQPPWKEAANEDKPLVDHKLFQESLRRDKVIKELAKTCKYKIGDIVKPYSKGQCAVMGEQVRVEKIVDSYAALGREEWPKDDCPKIVHAYSIDQDKHFFCTPAYLVPLTS